MLSHEIKKEYDALIAAIAKIPLERRQDRNISFLGGYVSVADLIAYQIGWGKLVIGWYDIGVVQGKVPEMPGEGFTTWSYAAIAKLFFVKWAYDSGVEQATVFHAVVNRLISIVETEHGTGNLDRLGVWKWATLPSGKQWPLSKWIKVNTASPYKRARVLMRQSTRSRG